MTCHCLAGFTGFRTTNHIPRKSLYNDTLSLTTPNNIPIILGPRNPRKNSARRLWGNFLGALVIAPDHRARDAPGCASPSTQRAEYLLSKEYTP